MRTRQEALDYGLSFPDTYQDAPFHDENWQLVKIHKNKKAFLCMHFIGTYSAKFATVNGLTCVLSLNCQMIL